MSQHERARIAVRGLFVQAGRHGLGVVFALLIALGSVPLHAAGIHPSNACASVNRRIEANLEAKCFAMDFGGRERTLYIYAPAGKHAAMPLVFVLHGGGGVGAGMEWLTKRGFNRLADHDGAVIVYPDGIGKSWNDGRSDTSAASAQEHIDDIGWFRALPHELSGQYDIDRHRVYVTGISNGGLMSYRIACDAADMFAAAAPVAASMSLDLAPVCKPARPISIAILNGTDDPIMPWGGGPVKVLWLRRGNVLSTAATLARWTELDHCSAVHAEPVVDSVPDDGTALARQSAQCAGASEVDLFEIRGGGHTWPAGEPYLGERFVGRVSRELDANVAIWTFFMRHRL